MLKRSMTPLEFTGRATHVRAARGLAFLLSSLAACTSSSHAYRREPAAGDFEDVRKARSDAESSSVATEESAPSAMSAQSQRADSSSRGRPAKASMPERKLAQAGGSPGRSPVTAPEPSRGEPARAVEGPVLIYTAQLTMAIFEVVPAQGKIEELIQSLGGFLSQKTNDSITVRVPVAHFHEAIAGIEKIGDVTRRDINAEDVSQEFFDLEVRLKSSRAVRERLEHLLARAVKVEDALGIEHELDRVVAEIERLEGRLKFLQQKAQYSTVTVNFAAQPKEMVTKGTFKLPFPWLDDLGLSRLLDLER